MALSRRIITKERIVPTASAGAAVVWRAPCAGRIVKVHGYRSGGSAAAVNAQIGATDVLAADLTAGNASFASAAPVGDAGEFEAGDVISLEVASATSTPTVIVQIDVAIDEDVRDL